MVASSTKRMNPDPCPFPLAREKGNLVEAVWINKKPRTGRGSFEAEIRSDLLGNDAHERVLLDALLAELHAAVRLGEQRVVRAGADVLARTVLGAALAHDDVAGNHLLTAGLLEAKSF